MLRPMNVWWWIGLGFSAIAVGLALSGSIGGGCAALGGAVAFYGLAVARAR